MFLVSPSYQHPHCKAKYHTSGEFPLHHNATTTIQEVEGGFTPVVAMISAGLHGP